ncbi:MAG: sugar phosphate isomerase/epimerase [Bacteroidales bacterium]|nr:sugar phosphate isomerase/epimerase [Bacteroidales bacterium]
MKRFSRRDFARKAAMAGIGTAIMPVIKAGEPGRGTAVSHLENVSLKISLNAYSFDKPLRAGSMTIDDLLDFCAAKGFDGVDLTGYYFPGYPQVPSDDYIYHVKQKAFRLGLGISGTGVKNDFTWSDVSKRAGEKQLVKDWIVVAEKLGSPIVRIFAGTLSKEQYKWEDRAKWIADDIRECAEFGKKHGVMTAMQNHNDFIKTSSDVEKMLKMVNSEWNGLLLDIGSYHSADPYKDIALNAKHAISWQLKEKVYINDNQVDTDYNKVISIVKECGYKGYLPLETLGEGDPAVKVEALFKKVKDVLNNSIT